MTGTVSIRITRNNSELPTKFYTLKFIGVNGKLANFEVTESGPNKRLLNTYKILEQNKYTCRIPEDSKVKVNFDHSVGLVHAQGCDASPDDAAAIANLLPIVELDCRTIEHSGIGEVITGAGGIDVLFGVKKETLVQIQLASERVADLGRHVEFLKRKEKEITEHIAANQAFISMSKKDIDIAKARIHTLEEMIDERIGEIATLEATLGDIKGDIPIAQLAADDAHRAFYNYDLDALEGVIDQAMATTTIAAKSKFCVVM